VQIFNHPFLFLAKNFKENIEISEFTNFSLSLPAIKKPGKSLHFCGKFPVF